MAKPKRKTPAKRRDIELEAREDPRDRSRADKRWYARPDLPHEAVQTVVKKLLKDGRRERLKLWRDLFLDAPRGDYLDHGLYRPGMRARFNVIRNVCETLLARIGKQQPRPWIVTVGGDWKLQRRAKAMGRFIEGDWERLGADRLRREQLLDALVFGTGLLKVFERDGRVAWGRTWCGNVLAPKREEAAGHVRTLYEIACVDKEVLAAEWPDERKKIEGLSRAPHDLIDVNDEDDDLVLVYESWHLPHGMDDNGEFIGGRHVITTDTCTLQDRPWTREGFPFSELHASRDPMRRWGIGYPERLAGHQSEQNSLSELASDVARKMTPKYVLQNGAQLMEDEATNEVGEFWRITGGTVDIVATEPVLMQLMQAAAMQRAEMYRIEGISEQSAEGSSPDNLESGKAKMVHRDIEAERHAELGQRNEENTVALCRLHIEQLEEIAARGEDEGKRLVVHAGKGMLEELAYADVRMGENPYVCRVYPVSKISGSPAGQLAQLQEMMVAKMITPLEARRLYDMPDLDRSNDLTFAGQDLASQLIEAALDGKAVAAPRYCDKQYLLESGWREYALARTQGATDAELKPLLNLLGHVKSLVDQEAAALAAATTPPAAPVQPPVQPTGPIGVVQ